MARVVGILGWLVLLGGIAWWVNFLFTTGEDQPRWEFWGGPLGMVTAIAGGFVAWGGLRMAGGRRLRAGARGGLATLSGVKVHDDPYTTYALVPVTCSLRVEVPGEAPIIGQYRATVGNARELLVDGACFPCSVDPRRRVLVRVYPLAHNAEPEPGEPHVDFHETWASRRVSAG